MSPKANTATKGADGATTESVDQAAAPTPAPGEEGYTPIGEVIVLAERKAGKFIHRVLQDAKHVWKEIVGAKGDGK